MERDRVDALEPRGAAAKLWNLGSVKGLALLNAQVTRQAAMISCLDEFKLTMIMSLLMAPLAHLIGHIHRGPAAAYRLAEAGSFAE